MLRMWKLLWWMQALGVVGSLRGAESGLTPRVASGLVERILRGDGTAEAELVERSGPALRFLCRRFCRHEADAEDLFQETLILALEKIRRGEVEEPDRLAGFLRALAKNLSTGQYRRRRYRVEQQAGEETEYAAENDPNPLQNLLVGERSRRARNLLSQLDVPRDREVLLRYYLGDEPSGAICADLDLPIEHFYRVLSRARRRYRRLWEEADHS